MWYLTPCKHCITSFWTSAPPHPVWHELVQFELSMDVCELAVWPNSKNKNKNPQISSWQRERTTARRLDSQWVKTGDLTETMAERRNQNALVRFLLWNVKAEELSVEFTAETNGAEQQQARPPGRKNVNIYCCFWILHWKQESIQRIHRNYTIIYGFTEAVNTYRITIYKKIYFTEI